MMVDKMYGVMDSACEKASNVTGKSIKFPRPSKRALQISALTNGLVGVGFTLFGVLSPYKWIILLGALGLINSFIVFRQTK
ncbi:hypothetical protein E0485_22330 [Paenibacillus albiflavus]|uniref:Uncharacterized protein n=1 Tax=Paenibacillus albiflavus TaxID=2545760 RepID=A0A4R4E280_9BACL|nr:hypothetical protein [Paenibacillus albiflavus]TCZ72325.1 hypothetical protein E0485_22330 [Paenibacillus albiflavus]